MDSIPADERRTGSSQPGAAHTIQTATAIAWAGTIALSSAMGIGRFAFTPLMPMMLHQGAVDLGAASWLATMNYVGYLVGAIACIAVPRLLNGSMVIRGGLVATALLTAGMAVPMPTAWPLLRFLAGIASAVVFVYTSGWCLAHLAYRQRPAMGATIFTGPGLGIALSGLAGMGMVSLGVSAELAWLVFAILAGVLAVTTWRVIQGPDAPIPVITPPAQLELEAVLLSETEAQAYVDAPSRPKSPVTGRVTRDAAGGVWEMSVFTLAYGFAGFGYIITATFLPVIARGVLAESVWLDLFWPILGIGVVVGALLAAKVPTTTDPRINLAICYVMQAAGVVMGLFFPSLPGFILGSLLVGLPFTAISFFVMQDVRRLHPHHAARFMGLLTSAYGLGQIAGPPLVSTVLRHAASNKEGFAWSLEIASLSLGCGAALYLFMKIMWPIAEGKAR